MGQIDLFKNYLMGPRVLRILTWCYNCLLKIIIIIIIIS